MLMTRKRSRWEPPEIFHTQFMGCIKNLVGQQVAVSEMVMGRYGHAVLDAGLLKGLFEGFHPFITIGGVIGIRSYLGTMFVARGFILANSLKRYGLFSVDLLGYFTAYGIFD